MSRKKLSVIFVSVIILAGFLVYFNSLGNGFVYDDELVVKDNAFLSSLGNIKYLFSNKYFSLSKEYSYRPLLTLTYILDYNLFKGKPFGFHLTNVIIHIINALLFYYFLFLFVFGLTGKKAAYPFSFLCALFFVLHPVQTEVVNGIAFREDALYTLFLFLSLIFYLKTKFSGRKIFYVFSLLGYFFALFCKESAIILPVFIFLIEIFYKKLRPKDAKDLPQAQGIKFNPYFGYLAVLGIVLFIRFFLLSAPESFLRSELSGRGILKGPGRPGGSLFTAMLTTARIFISYIGLFFFPWHLAVERVVLPSYSVFDPRVLLSVALLILLIIFFFRNFNRRFLISFAGFWFLLCLLPAANIMPLYHAMADRYLYLACAGFCIFMGVTVFKFFSFPSKVIKAATLSVVLLYIAFFSWRTITRNSIWKDNFVFCQERAKYPPVTERIYSGLGIAYIEKGQLDEAEEYLRKSIEANPQYFAAYYNLGNLYSQRNLSDKAREYYKKAIELNPYQAQVYNNLGNAYFRVGLYDEAKENYEKALELSPMNYDVRNNLGNVYFRKGLYEKAENEYKEAIKLKPGSADSLNNLAALYAARGQYDRAIAQYRELIEANLTSPQLYYNLGIAYYKKGMIDKTEESFKKAVQLNPAYQPGWDSLGKIYYEKGGSQQAINFYSKVIKENPSNLFARNSLAGLYMELKLYEEAAKEYAKILEIDPRSVLAHHHLGNIYFMRDSFDKAKAEYEKVIELEPNFIEAYNNLGAIYFKKGFPEKARKYWEKALEINPNYSQAKDNLKALQNLR